MEKREKEFGIAIRISEGEILKFFCSFSIERFLFYMICLQIRKEEGKSSKKTSSFLKKDVVGVDAGNRLPWQFSAARGGTDGGGGERLMGFVADIVIVPMAVVVPPKKTLCGRDLRKKVAVLMVFTEFFISSSGFWCILFKILTVNTDKSELT